MINLPNYFPEPPLDPPEEKLPYETIYQVPDDVKDDWIESHRDEIIEHFEDEIFDYATERAIEYDENYYEED